MIEGVEAGTVSPGEAASHIFSMTSEYEFPIQLRSEALARAGWLKPGDRISQRDVDFRSEWIRWALTNPNSRDLCATIGNLFSLAAAHSPDPHLV